MMKTSVSIRNTPAAKVSRYRQRAGFGCLLLAALLVFVGSTEAIAQTLATHKFSAGWATFGLPLPPGVAWSGVQVGEYATQVDIKTTWPDGSIRFAVVTARITSSGSYPITPATNGAGGSPLTWPAASVRLVIGSTTWTAPLPSRGADPWLAGPLVSESRALVTPTAGGTPHPFLRVLYDVRSYAGGGQRVDVTVQNTLNVTTANRVTYNVAIDVNGSTVFQQNAVEHPYLMRWRKVFRTGLTEAAVTPDLGPFYAADAIPRYLRTMASKTYSMTGTQFGILRPGGLNPRMPDAGGRAEIAPYPEWVAIFATFKNRDAYDYLLRHGDLAGSWSGHLTEPDGFSLLTIDAHPKYWTQEKGTGERPANGMVGVGFVAGDGQYEQMPDNAHVPSLAFVPYLLTGDRYYADEMAFWANFALLSQPWTSRQESQGLLADNQTRGMAWGLRNIVDAAAWLPDAHPYREYFTTKIYNNLRWFDEQDGTTQRPLGSWHEAGNGTSPEYLVMAPWQNAYLAWSIMHANRQGFSGGERLMDRLARFQLRLFVDTQWRREEAGPYYLAMGQSSNSVITWYSDLATVRARTVQHFGSVEPLNALSAYCVEARLSLLVAQARGMPGAESALAWLIARAETVSALRGRAGYALHASSFGNPQREIVMDSDFPLTAPANLRILR